MQGKQVEILRSGFLADGRFYSIEAGRLKGGRWGAWIVCVPGNAEVEKRESRALQVVSRREQLCKWADQLSDEEIERYAGGCRD